ncbi:hypothetical protein CANINC_000143 [Pichia inconspicua]|uniref:DUF676 domain-containing protein n=1 Tax=Pichia inconspicua TaxID=52247 RepID=A0A4V6TTT8_9ASCO|nr:hypothetical protein CANINC_000143 [[Candida] inconspicua]
MPSVVNSPQTCHLIVLSHGLWGTQEHFSYVEQQLIETLKSKCHEKIFKTYKTCSNEKFKTYDGIDLCGSRVADEILNVTAHLLQHDNLVVTEFSLIGYSLGGLIGRFAIGVLTYRKYFENITPINFVTFCTPHVGVLTPGNSFSIKCFNNIVPYLLGNSGKQMFLKDSVYLEDSGESVPLLKLMATENSIFMQGLKMFRNHALYSNVRSDIRTSWWTSGISYINPFEILDKNPNVVIDNYGFINFSQGSKFSLSFIDNYNPTIIDMNKPIHFQGLIDYESEKDMKKTKVPKVNTEENYIDNFIVRKLKWLTVLFNTFIYVPMWTIWFILFNILQLFNSFFRVNREASKLKDNCSIYQLVETVSQAIDSVSTTPNLKPTISRTLSGGGYVELSKLENDLHDQGDFFLDSVFDAVTSSKTPNQSIFNQEKIGDLTLSTSLTKICSISIDDINDWEKDYKLLADNKKEAFEYYQLLKPFKMNMSLMQRDIISNLNKLNWKKHPIYITNTNSTHAAAIVRHQDPTFEEGKIVVAHFCNEIFVH